MKTLTIYYLFTNLLCLGIYAWDKFAAIRSKPRITETKLHLFALLGGGIGALLGQSLFRHKTQKTIFALIAYGSLVLHLGLIAYLFSRF